MRIVQLRMKDASDAEHLALVPALLGPCQAHGASLIINDRLQVAASCKGLGLHLGQEDIDPRQARQALGPSALIGLSTSSPAEALAAQQLPIDYIGFGPIYSSSGKHLSPNDRRSPRAAVGLSALKEVVQKARVPVVAIGGIELQHLPDLKQTGVHAVAVISAISSSASYKETAMAFQQGLDAKLE